MRPLIKVKEAIICEGKYDKIKLESILDANIITTGGFSIFNNDEKMMLIKRIAEKNGLIILTDSDPAGFVLRNKIKGMLSPNDNILHIYIPTEKGKEKRKKEYSKAGLLGVEGIDAEKLKELFSKYTVNDKNEEAEGKKDKVTKACLYELGLSGKDGSSEKREFVAEKFGLPKGMSANAFLEAINIVGIKKNDIASLL